MKIVYHRKIKISTINLNDKPWYKSKNIIFYKEAEKTVQTAAPCNMINIWNSGGWLPEMEETMTRSPQKLITALYPKLLHKDTPQGESNSISNQDAVCQGYFRRSNHNFLNTMLQHIWVVALDSKQRGMVFPCPVQTVDKVPHSCAGFFCAKCRKV